MSCKVFLTHGSLHSCALGGFAMTVASSRSSISRIVPTRLKPVCRGTVTLCRVAASACSIRMGARRTAIVIAGRSRSQVAAAPMDQSREMDSRAVADVEEVASRCSDRFRRGEERLRLQPAGRVRDIGTARWNVGSMHVVSRGVSRREQVAAESPRFHSGFRRPFRSPSRVASKAEQARSDIPPRPPIRRLQQRTEVTSPAPVDAVHEDSSVMRGAIAV